MKLGARLSQKRNKMGLSQEKMAEICHVSARHYHDLEAGKVNTSLRTAARLSPLLNFSLDDLINKWEESGHALPI